jgi:hypothetical protein
MDFAQARGRPVHCSEAEVSSKNRKPVSDDSISIELLLPPSTTHGMRTQVKGLADVYAKYHVTDCWGPMSRGAIYRRHGLLKYQAVIETAGVKELEKEMAKSREAKECLMSMGDFLSYELCKYCTHSPALYYECLLNYKAERARSNKDFNKEDYFRDLKAKYRKRFPLDHDDRFDSTTKH